MGVEPKIVVFTTQIMNFNTVFHYFHHPFWGIPIFGNTHILSNYYSFYGSSDCCTTIDETLITSRMVPEDVAIAPLVSDPYIKQP